MDLFLPHTVSYWEFLGEDWHGKIAEAAHWCYENLDSNSWLHSPQGFEFKYHDDWAWFRLTWT